MKKYKMKDVGEIISGGTPSTTNKSFWNGSIPWITPRDLSRFSGKYISTGERNITKEGLKRSSAKLLPPGTILLSSRAPIGYLVIAKNSVCTNQGFKSIICNKDVVDNEYLYYLLSTKVDDLKLVSTGTTFKELSTTAFKQFQISLPSLEKQRHIVDTIGSIDDLIDRNSVVINNIDSYLKLNFKAVSAITKNKVQVKNLNLTITDFVANGSFKSLKNNTEILNKPDYAFFIRNIDLKTKNFLKYVSKETYTFLKKSSLKGGEIIISNVGSVGSVYLCPVLSKPMTLGNNMILISNINREENFYLYYFFKSIEGQHLISSITGGSAQPKFNKTDFKKLVIPFPAKDKTTKFNKIALSLSQLLNGYENENRKLLLIKNQLLEKYF